MASYENRFQQNAPGKFYVDDQCIDCDLCRERIPEVFLRNDEDAHSYVGCQPRDEAELTLCREALDDCPIEAIGCDGEPNLTTSKIKKAAVSIPESCNNSG